MESSPEEIISPAKHHVRKRGGRREGAGRKKKETPEKTGKKTVTRTKYQRDNDAKWLKSRRKLSVLARMPDSGKKFDKELKNYLKLGRILGKKAEVYVLPSLPLSRKPPSESSDETSGDEDESSSSESSTSSSSDSTVRLYCQILYKCFLLTSEIKFWFFTLNNCLRFGS
jgi:hypothetical protein